MHLSSNSEAILISRECSWLTSCTRLSLVYGSHSSHIYFAYLMWLHQMECYWGFWIKGTMTIWLCSIIVRLIHDRYWMVPPFSQSICTFSNNVSNMKRLAARDFEDLLQVRVTVFLLTLHTILMALLSVPSQPLRVSWRSIITNALSNYCIGQQNGMVLPSLGCTPSRHWIT